MISENKVLLVNEDPYVRTYTYHGFYNAIISSSQKVDKIAAKIDISDFQKYGWKVKNQNLNYNIGGSVLTFIADKWNTNMNACFWRSCQEIDSIKINILKQIFANTWSAINLFICHENQKDMLNDDEYIYRLGNFSRDGIYLRINNSSINISPQQQDTDISLKLEIENNQISAFQIIQDQKILLNTWSLPLSAQSYRIGFELKLGCNAYYEWLFSNYIQIFGSADSPYNNLDFLFTPFKNGHSYEINYFLNYATYEKGILDVYALSLLEMIKINISNGCYIEMWLNENILDKKEDYGGKGHFHQNLIYGYDDIKQELFILQYVKGKIQKRKMNYNDFESIRNTSVDFPKIVVVKYFPDSRVYKLDMKYIKRMFTEYLSSYNSSEGIQHLIMPEEKIYGINSLKNFLKNDNVSVLSSDIRISHLLLEKANIMKYRMEYFFYRNLINCGNFKYINSLVSQEVEYCKKLRNLVIKNKIQQKQYYLETMKNYLQEIVDIQTKYLNKLIQIL